jgi:hypothetical protein
MSTNNLTPLSEVIKDLKSRGFEKDFIFRENKLTGIEDNDKSYTQNELKIVKEYRFEGDSDPGMMTILYALEADDGSKGTIANGFGVNSDKDLGEFMKKVEDVSHE